MSSEAVTNFINDRFHKISDDSVSVLDAIFKNCGVDVDTLNKSDGEYPPQELKEILGRVWVMYARVCSLEKEFRKEISDAQAELEVAYAIEYAKASDALPKSTETAKKNWITAKAPIIGKIELSIRNLQYMMDQCGVAEKSIKIRCDMLQSINKLTVTELERLHVHLDGST